MNRHKSIVYSTILEGTIKSTDPKIDQPDNIKIPLFDHQLTSIYRAKELEESTKITFDDNYYINTRVGILADEVGAGKSYEALSLVAMKKKLDLTHQCSNLIKTHLGNITIYENMIKMENMSIFSSSPSTNNIYIPCNLFIVPDTVYDQWVSYIKEFTGLIFYYIENKSDIPDSNFYINFCKSKKIKYSSNIKNLDVIHYEKIFSNYDGILINRTMANEFLKPIHKSIIWSRVFIDEADTIEIPYSESLVNTKQVFLWMITASIENLIYIDGKYENNVKIINGIKRGTYIYRFFHNLNNIIKKEIANIFIRCTTDYIKQSQNLPDPITYRILSRTPLNLRVVSELISSEAIKKINAGDIEGAVDEINIHKIDSTKLVEIFISNYLIKKGEIEGVLKDIEEDEKNMMKGMVTKYNNKFREELKNKKEKELKEVNENIKYIEDKIKEAEMCPICCDDVVTAPTVTTCCRNMYCFECIINCLETNPHCPSCRKEIDIKKDLVYLKDSDDDDGDNNNDSDVEMEDERDYSNFTKDENLEYLFKNKFGKNSRVLIFSEYDESFSFVSNMLAKEKIRSIHLNGKNITSVKHAIKEYKKEETDLCALMMNAKYLGPGLNLENTTDVVIYHKMPIAMKRQIIGRAQRVGRKDKLKIWELCYENEY